MKHGVHMAAALALTVALGIPGAAAAAPESAPELALRRVLLSSGGVGYFEYEATLQGASDLRLSVRRDQVDDVLKSLVVFDEAGNLGEVSLPGKELLSESLRELRIPQGALDSPTALLTALRGAEIQVELHGNVIVGRIVSVTEEQVKRPGGDTVTQHRLSLIAEGTLHQVIVEEIDSLRVLDPTLQTQLDTALDALSRQRERDRRELTIHLAGTGPRVVRAGYVAEVPLWKSTYRLVLPPSSGSGPGTDKAALTGFAVVENRTGEPWNDVDLTLTAGNPVTFRQAIYDTYYVDRPSVPVEVLGRVLPRRDEGGVALPTSPGVPEEPGAEDAVSAGLAHGGFQFGGPRRWARPPKVAPVTPAESQEEATQVVFHLPSPVSLPSGQTALLPIISLDLSAPRVSLYQPDTEARHPLSSLELTNDSTSDLPPGVLSIYERGARTGELTYAGDAQLSLLPAGESRFISYAVDLRMTVDRAAQTFQTITLATIADGTLKLTRTERYQTTYTLANAADEPRRVIIEHPRLTGFNLVTSDDYQVLEVTETRYRLRREVPKGATIKMPVILQRPLMENVSLSAITKDQLSAYAASMDLPASVREALQRIINRRAEVAARETTLSQRNAERARILEDQARIRENLKAVPGGSDLAKRYLTRLGEQEERLTTLDAEIAAAESAVNAAREALAAEIRTLGI